MLAKSVRLRIAISGILAINWLLQTGCAPAPPPVSVLPATPTPTISEPPPNTTISQPTTGLPEGVVTVFADDVISPKGSPNPTQRAEFRPLLLPLQFAGEERAKRVKDLIAVLDSVTDDATATAAAAKLPATGLQYADAVKEYNVAMGAISASGNQDLVISYLQEQAVASPEAELLAKIERAVNGPQGKILRRAINGLFDAWLQNASSDERRGLERLIEKQKLRR